MKKIFIFSVLSIAASLGTSGEVSAQTMDSISPNTGNPGQTINATITGSGFSGGGAPCSAANSLGAQVVVNSCTENSPMQVILNFTIDPAAPSVVTTFTVTANGGAPAGTINFGIGMAPPNIPPTVSITGPASGSSFPVGTSITFTGTATDPEDGNLTSQLTWTSSIDGPHPSTGSPITSNTLSIGTHTITASVTDSGSLQGADAIAITVSAGPPPPNIAPTVNAGSDQTIILPTNTVILNGTVTDDGLPSPPGLVTTTWTKVSGPAATIASPSSVNTGVTLTGGAGVYIFRLSALDGSPLPTVTDDVIVTLSTVIPPGPPGPIPTTVPSFSATAVIGILQNVGDWIFVLAMLIAVIMAIIGATFFLTGGSDPNRVATGRKIFLWGGVGLVVILLARGIFAVLRGVLGG